MFLSDKFFYQNNNKILMTLPRHSFESTDAMCDILVPLFEADRCLACCVLVCVLCFLNIHILRRFSCVDFQTLYMYLLLYG